MRRLVRNVTLMVVCSLMPGFQSAPAAQAASCVPKGTSVAVPGVSEGSGIAASRRVAGRLYTHNDSGKPTLTVLDSAGAVTGTIAVNGAAVEDWEAIAVGSCGNESCIYVGDIGDNDARRPHITVYRAPEPDAAATSVKAEAFKANYPDGAHDAEALLVANGRVYVVTKGETGPIAIYRFPAELQSGVTMRLERVAELSSTPSVAARITDGAVSPDGQWVVLRTKGSLAFYRAAVLTGPSKAVATVDLTPLNEPQGEGIALGADDTLFLISEGGGKKRPGVFTRFTCAPPRS